MNLAEQMLHVRKQRDEIDRHLEKIENLCSTDEARELLVKSWYARKDLQNHALLLDHAIARLHNLEKEAMQMKAEEEQWDTVFDNGRLCP